MAHPATQNVRSAAEGPSWVIRMKASNTLGIAEQQDGRNLGPDTMKWPPLLQITVPPAVIGERKIIICLDETIISLILLL